jgi:hypothetical protein
VAYEPADFDGRSFAPILEGGAEQVHESLYFELGYVQLYDLEADPGELKNLAADPAHAEVLADMKRELQRYLDELPGEFPLAPPD